MEGKLSRSTAKFRFINNQIQPTKQLKGFQKHHKLPASSNGGQDFLAEASFPEMEADLEEKFSALRTAFGFKRKEISVSGPENGLGLIETPFFNYEISVSFVEGDPSKTLWLRIINEIREPNQVFNPVFTEVFGKQFNALEMDLQESLDLEGVVDHIEDLDSDQIAVNYDKDLTWCEIKFSGSMATVRLERSGITIANPVQESSPQELLGLLMQFRERVLSTMDLDAGSMIGDLE